jgi:uncharacterized protein (UPF0548 family)
LVNRRRLALGPPWLTGRTEVRAQLEQIQDLDLNFDPTSLSSLKQDAWHVDDYCRSLPSEQVGEPIPAGSFETAKHLLGAYEFADPKRIRAHYWADAPLEGRDMLLEIRYLALRVRVGVRIGVVFDELREMTGREVRVWGWAYRTLQGHLERGQMDYQVWKWLDTGEVEYRIHAVAQPAETRSPILDLGFRLVGRRQQVLFARRCAERMQQLVEGRLDGDVTELAPRSAGGIVTFPSYQLP